MKRPQCRFSCKKPLCFVRGRVAFCIFVSCAALCGRLASSYALVAECGGALAGFANLGEDGYFDCLYVSSQMQGRGVATALADAMERRAAQQGASRMVSDVSITARPFFEHRGYRVVQEQTVVRHGVAMTNYHMEKVLP